MKFFSAINGDIPVREAALAAAQFGKTLAADGDLGCYVLVDVPKSQIVCISEFRKRQRHTHGLNLNTFSPCGRQVLPQDDPTPPRAA